MNDVKQKANYKKISNKSEKITNEIKNAVFTRIFEMLDVDNEGRLTGHNIDPNYLPDNLKKIFEPLLNELKEQDESLTHDEFLMACEHLYGVFMNFIT